MRLSTLRQVRLPNQSVHILRDVLRDAGLDPDAPFAAARIPTEVADRPEATVSGSEELAFQWAFVEETADRPDLWLRAGWRYAPLTLGLLGIAVLAAPTLGEWATLGRRWADYTYSLADYRPIVRGDAVVGFEMSRAAAGTPLWEFSVYRVLGSTARVLHEIWRDQVPPTRVELPRRLPWAPGFRSIGSVVETGADSVRWIWPEDAARRPSPSANRLLYELCLEQHRRLQAELVSPAPLVSRLLDTIAAPGAPPLHLSEAARELHMSTRTLERRLEDEGLHYRDLQQAARTKEAKRLLLTTPMTVSEIAHRLGYADLSSFSYAFKLRTGLAPTAWRRQRTGRALDAGAQRRQMKAG